MKKLLFALFILVVASPALAQDRHPPIVEAARNRVVAFLELDEVQEAAWDILYEEHLDAEQPLRDDVRAVQEQIDALFESGAMNPTELGELVIVRRELAVALRQVHDIYHEGVRELLDDGQEKKLMFLARADDAQEIIPAFKLFELIPRR
jgi:hypothetical protein